MDRFAVLKQDNGGEEKPDRPESSPNRAHPFSCQMGFKQARYE